MWSRITVIPIPVVPTIDSGAVAKCHPSTNVSGSTKRRHHRPAGVRKAMRNQPQRVFSGSLAGVAQDLMGDLGISAAEAYLRITPSPIGAVPDVAACFPVSNELSAVRFGLFLGRKAAQHVAFDECPGA